jgi:hypothetical protein
MSIYGGWQTATIASSGTTSSVVNLGADFEFIQVQLPALDSTTLQVTTSDKYEGTYQALGSSVLVGATTGAYNDVWKLGGWRFLKIVAGSAQTGGARSIKVRGMRV